MQELIERTTKDRCKSAKPNAHRACVLLNTRKGYVPVWPDQAAQQWRDDLFWEMEKVFHKACPYTESDFASTIHNFIKGYLVEEPFATFRSDQFVYGTMEEGFVKHMAASIDTEILEEVGTKLRKMDPFWEHIISALQHCSTMVTPLEFWHDEDLVDEGFLSFAHKYPNGTIRYIPVQELYMTEQADVELAFNFAVDMSWKIFVTVLGTCMPSYEKKIPLITGRFYGLFSRDFLYPLRQLWMSNRDNPVFKLILGNMYGKTEKWVMNCMEASFVQSGNVNMRPPRSLYVGSFTEMNFFRTGPLAGTRGMYAQDYL